ncbi:MAG: tyrosine-type recombinase/integrase [Gammaproteobacteria bacterium]|nr:tyrosine-type recombinase/integrase [Gammaproteobacteria bacterium]
MELAKIRFGDHQISWTVLDNGEPVGCVRDWILHLEETNQSPNTVQAYARHVARFGTFLQGRGKSFYDVAVVDYDSFFKWLPRSLVDDVSAATPNLLYLSKPVESLSPALRNQVHLSIKSFYRYLSGRSPVFDQSEVSTRYQGVNSYKPFLEHINQRRSVRKKDKYLQGDLGAVQQTITEKRLSPEVVLSLIGACTLLRDAFLITLLYNSGMRIGEALGLRHADIVLDEQLIWVIPRADNENGARAKSRKSRAIPVMPYVINMYEDYITSDEYSAAFESGTEYVFCNVQRGSVGRALSKSYVENLKKYLIKRTGYPFTWHQFRHTHASEAIADGHGLLQVADRLGHSSPQTTLDFYKHLFSSEIRKLHLTGPANLEKRLEEFRSSGVHLTDRGIKWI